MSSVRSRPHSRTPTPTTDPVRRVDVRIGVEPSSVAPGDDSLSHTDLLSLARSVQAAALADDLSELSSAVRRLRQGLRRHVESDRRGQDHLTPTLRAVVFGGQDRLLRLVDAISTDAHDDHGRACIRQGAELVAALRRQAVLEAAVLLRVGDEG